MNMTPETQKPLVNQYISELQKRFSDCGKSKAIVSFRLTEPQYCSA